MEERSPPRTLLYVWFLCRGRLKTGALLANLHVVSVFDSCCPYCGNLDEAIEHMFFTCLIAWRIWSDLLIFWGIEAVLHKNNHVNIMSWSSFVRGHLKFVFGSRCSLQQFGVYGTLGQIKFNNVEFSYIILL